MLNKISEYINSLQYGMLTFAFEMLVIIASILLIIAILVRYIKSKNVIISYGIMLSLLLLSLILQSDIGMYIVVVSLILLTIGCAIYYIPELKQFAGGKINAKQNKHYLSNIEVKEQLIETLLKSVKHLSSRRIGAIITIEKEHSLNTLVNSSVKIDALVSYELLESIFHPNTALHDGAVIIRGDRIKCASAFYQSTQKNDIPQHYGSRHRAAIGISEQSDAFTIVVSEETGHVATTIGGTITGNVSLEGLKLSLEQHIIVKNN